MTHNGKITRQTVRHDAYSQAFARLDAALAKNARSRVNDIEKIDRLRLAVFGCLPETVEKSKNKIMTKKIRKRTCLFISLCPLCSLVAIQFVKFVSMARNGKIARLPREIRDELNLRLHNGEPGGPLLAWLNGSPEVRKILVRDFGGSPISKQNLSEWRAGGFAEWQARQDTLDQARELVADANEITAATDGRLTDHLATVLAVRYAALLQGWNGEVTDEFRRELRTLRGMCQDIVELRRGDHSGARLKMEQERLEREREKTEEEVVAHFQRWLKNPEVRDLVCQNYITRKNARRGCAKFLACRQKRRRPPEPLSRTPAGRSQTQSNPVKPIFQAAMRRPPLPMTSIL